MGRFDDVYQKLAGHMLFKCVDMYKVPEAA